MTRRAMILSVLSPLLLGAAGCQPHFQHSYDTAAADLAIRGRGTVAVATHDQRPYVTSGEKGPDYVGRFNGGFGVPAHLTTGSGAPLSTDLSRAIRSAIEQKGLGVRQIATAPDEAESAVVDRLRGTGADRLLLLTLDNWKTTTYTTVELFYDIELKVFSGKGVLLGRKQLEGQDDLGGSMWDPKAVAAEVAPKAFARKLEELFAAQEIQSALDS